MEPPGARPTDQLKGETVDRISLAQHAFERALRGLQAWRRGAVGRCGGEWVVAGEGGAIYRVDLREQSCSCPDFEHRGEPCKHLFAATVARAKTAECSGCGERFPHRELVELTEDSHDGLTYFDGDRLCGECADGAGVVR